MGGVHSSTWVDSRLLRAMLLIAGALILAVPSPSLGFEKWRAKAEIEISGAGKVPFNQPGDMALFEGKIYVLDSLNNRICVFDSRGKHLRSVRGTAAVPLVGAMGLARDDRGRFFVADGYRGRILTFTGKNEPTRFINLVKGEEQDPPDPTDVLFFGDKLYVVDNDNHLVRIFSSDAREEGTWGGLGEGYGLFKYPFRLAVDPRGRLAVTDVLNSRVQLFTPKGDFLGSLGGPGVVSGTLFRPGGFDIDQEGRFYIADNYFGNIQVFDISGRLIAVIHDDQGRPLQFENPVSLEVDRDRLYVVEMGADRLRVFSLKR
jgi:DNA-binding beta-propeller fold protein YncE